jgi:predicted RNase H-like HicB family nuclease
MRHRARPGPLGGQRERNNAKCGTQEPKRSQISEHVYSVKAEWDDEASVWVASSEDVPGLVTEAPTLEALVEKLRVMVPEMLELNGVLPPDAAALAPFKLTAERLEHPRAVA